MNGPSLYLVLAGTLGLIGNPLKVASHFFTCRGRLIKSVPQPPFLLNTLLISYIVY